MNNPRGMTMGPNPVMPLRPMMPPRIGLPQRLPGAGVQRPGPAMRQPMGGLQAFAMADGGAVNKGARWLAEMAQEQTFAPTSAIARNARLRRHGMTMDEAMEGRFKGYEPLSGKTIMPRDPEAFDRSAGEIESMAREIMRSRRGYATGGRVPGSRESVDMLEDGRVVVRHIFFGDSPREAEHMLNSHRRADESLDDALKGKPYKGIDIKARRFAYGGYAGGGRPDMSWIAIRDALRSMPNRAVPDYLLASFAGGGKVARINALKQDEKVIADFRRMLPDISEEESRMISDEWPQFNPVGYERVREAQRRNDLDDAMMEARARRGLPAEDPWNAVSGSADIAGSFHPRAPVNKLFGLMNRMPRGGGAANVASMFVPLPVPDEAWALGSTPLLGGLSLATRSGNLNAAEEDALPQRPWNPRPDIQRRMGAEDVESQQRLDKLRPYLRLGAQ